MSRPANSTDAEVEALRIKWDRIAPRPAAFSPERDPDCPTCGDAGRVDGGSRLCPDCTGKLMDQARWNLCGLPQDTLNSKRLELFSWGALRQGQRVRRAIMEWAEGVAPPWLALVGPLGTGKTHLAIGLLMAALERGESVVFHRIDSLLGSLKASMGNDDWGFDDEFRRLCTIPLLVIDDLAGVSFSQWEADTLFALLDSRYRERRLTVCTMDVEPRLFPLDRVASRLCDVSVCQAVGLDGDDYRKRRGV